MSNQPETLESRGQTGLETKITVSLSLEGFVLSLSFGLKPNVSARSQCQNFALDFDLE